jgi:glycosyltransferase involved in cell wall biosynthesis
MHREASLGVSVVVCSHNGVKRLPPTLTHLRSQIVPPEIDWEVVFVDNASTDGTAELAGQFWIKKDLAPLRVVREPRLGVRNARERGLKEARYEIIGFVDDDVWVSEQWVATVSEIMSTTPRLGAVGSLIHPEFEVAPPGWWKGFEEAFFGILRDVPSQPPRYLNTGGTAIRRSAWQELIYSGFRSRMIGRKGRNLSCGEDNELTFALSRLGWILKIDPRLSVSHFIGRERVTWPYMRRMVRSHATSWVLLDAYFASQEGRQFPPTYSVSWVLHALNAVKHCFLHPQRLWRWMFSEDEGDPEVMEQEREFGRIIGLLSFRNQYSRLMNQARQVGRQIRCDGSET